MKVEWTNKDSLASGETTKAILVVDIDDDIKNYGGSVYHYPSRRFVHIDVPLKPMPDIKTEEAIKLANMINPKATFQEFADGWNACIEEIEK